MGQGEQATSAVNPAEVYESFFVPAMFAPLAALFLERANPQPGESVLDVACGTGIVARRAAPLVGRSRHVVGLDPSPAMLLVARSVSDTEGVSVEWREGRAEALPFPDNSFDLALCQMGLQFFPDKPTALAEMRRVLANGGRVGLAVWQGFDKHPVWATLNGAMLKRLGIPAVHIPFSLGNPDELRALLTAASFSGVEVQPLSITTRFRDPERFVPLQVSASAAAIPSLQTLDPDARRRLADAVQADMESTIRGHTVEDYLEIPMHALVVLGRRQ
jgi:ubiquinone/menaquinone biosynthesis C-methylase UbiE